MDVRTRRRLGFLAAFGAYFAALWLLWYSPIVYPLKIFVVLLHEVSHGLVAVATGGEIQRIVVAANQGGLCECPGGNAFLTLSAGYLGSLGWGALLFWGGVRTGNGARWLAAAIGLGTALFTAFFVRNPFGVLFGLGFGLALLAGARFLDLAVNRALVGVLGLTSALYAILDIKSDVLDRPELPSDARVLSDLTGVPTLVWGVLWIGTALFVVWRLLRWAYRRS